jgi:hypothetical protein
MSGLKMTTNGDEVLADLTEYVGQIQDKLDDDTIKECLREIGKTIKGYVRQYAPKRSKKNQTHIIDDIKSSVKKSKTTGNYFVTVSGGPGSGYRWNWVNGGHVAANGRFVEGNHFVDKAEKACEPEVMTIVDKYIERALK